MVLNYSFPMASIILCLFSSATAAWAQGEVRISVYSDISAAKCRVIQGRLSGPAEHEKVVHRCPTMFGFQVTKAYLGAAVQLTIAKPPAAGVAPQFGAGYDVGERIEWRGVKTKTGFTPQAAIVRLTSRNERGRLESVLAIARVDSRVCPAAWLDAGANPQPNELARKSADRIIETFRCGADDPQIIGPTTDLVKDIAARSPAAQK